MIGVGMPNSFALDGHRLSLCAMDGNAAQFPSMHLMALLSHP
jgi:hypothetical protein